jgi:hypothetical protein
VNQIVRSGTLRLALDPPAQMPSDFKPGTAGWGSLADMRTKFIRSAPRFILRSTRSTRICRHWRWK